MRQWLADDDVKEKPYYYWLRKFRQERCKQMQLSAATALAEVSLAELPIPVLTLIKPAAADNTVAVIIAIIV
ncbi:MAG: hypothetical protein HDR03_06165 [Lachnospiraceae bacterium]|nr:hypothetical protein [Lachnospiraceae bacterium]